jgi:hypothetical protein
LWWCQEPKGWATRRYRDPSGLVLCDYGPSDFGGEDFEDADDDDECTSNGGTLSIDQVSITVDGDLQNVDLETFENGELIYPEIAQTYAANNTLPPCKQNVKIPVPQSWQNSALSSNGWTVTGLTLSANGNLTGFQIANLTPLNFQGLELPGNSRLTVQTAPGGFTLDVSGGPGYLELPTQSWYSAGVNYTQFANGQFTNVNGEAATIPGSSLLGSILGINSQIQNTLNNTLSAVGGAQALGGALANCSF